MITLDLAIALRVIRRGLYVRHSGDTDELFKVAGDELRPVVRDDSWLGIGVLFTPSLEDCFDIDFLHFLTDIPLND